MPPRRSARVAAAAELACTALAPLPQPLALRILALLPVDARARCACVSPGWRATVADVSLWLRLDLTAAGGVPQRRLTDALLRGAAARAGGHLCALDVRGCSNVSYDAALAVAAANAGSLRELRCDPGWVEGLPVRRGFTCVQLEALVRAAPALRMLEVKVDCTGVAEARRALCCGPLRNSFLSLNCADADEAALRALAADLAQPGVFTAIILQSADFTRMPAALEACVGAVLAARTLRSMEFSDCRLSPGAAPALARLLRGGLLTELIVFNNHEQLLDAPAARLFAAALRDSTQLSILTLCRAGLWREPMVAPEVLGALMGHPSLRFLAILGREVAAHGADGAAALAGLVAANSAALHVVSIAVCHLGDAGLRPLLDALPHNTNLRTLDIRGNDLSAAFARDVLLPALRANTSLRVLHAHDPDDENWEDPLAVPFLEAAQALVEQRAAAAA